MPLSEFSAIQHYFMQDSLRQDADGVVLGIGDDAAVLAPPAGQQLVVSADTLVQGVHFPSDSAPKDIGYRSLAVNLSDLAAMAATPRWYTLCLTAPALEDAWLSEFCAGLAAAARGTGIALVGGDTTSGPLTISVQVMGSVEAGTALQRYGASPGDGIYVTGTLGDAAAGLALLESEQAPSISIDHLIDRFLRPTPRLVESRLLVNRASSCIDISDGLLADLGHICERSAVAAEIWADQLPLSPELKECSGEQALANALAGGDDYELCFTVPPAAEPGLLAEFEQQRLECTRIGQVIEGSGVRCLDARGNLIQGLRAGYEHFRT